MFGMNSDTDIDRIGADFAEYFFQVYVRCIVPENQTSLIFMAINKT